MTNRTTRTIKALFVGLAILGTGCAAERYSAIAPAELRGPLAANAGRPTQIDGLEYELFVADGQTVISVINRTGVPLRLSAASSMFDATGRNFAIDEQLIAPDTSGRVIVPPPFATERADLRQPPPTDIEPRVGGFDNGGIVTRERLTVDDTATIARGFRWPDDRHVRVRLIFERDTQSAVAPTTRVAPSTEPVSITEEFVLTRSRR